MLLKNLRPDVKLFMASWRIDLINKLRGLRRSHKKLLKKADKYQPPHGPSQSIMPEVAYQRQKSPILLHIEEQTVRHQRVPGIPMKDERGSVVVQKDVASSRSRAVYGAVRRLVTVSDIVLSR
jgi:hypothetical protein